MTRFKNVQGQILATTNLHTFAREGQTVILKATTLYYPLLS